jgi:predicted PurR-regulated permease PerM
MKDIQGRLVIYLVGFACVFVILFGIRASASIINPIMLAAVITITVLPLPSLLTKRGLPGWLSLILSILLVVVILGLVIATVFFSVSKLSTQLPVYLASGSAQATQDLSSSSDSSLIVEIGQITTGLGTIAQGVLETTFSLLVQFGLALVIFLFMISAAMALPTPSRLGLDPNTPVIGRVTSLTGDVRKYITTLTFINLLVGIGDTIFLWIMGVPYALLWGLLAWFMGYIPSIGFWIALIPPVLLAYAIYGLQTALIVFVVYVLINGGIQNFVQPKIMGDRLRISPVIVFVSLLIWGYLLGGIGAILAVPMTMMVLIFMENFEGTRPIAVLMRYTGPEKQEERQEALRDVKGIWGKLKGTIIPEKKTDENVE